MKNQNGITLIALVITIIVLLILAGVAIAMLSGENGILNKASESAKDTAISSAKETIGLKVNEAITEYYDSVYVDGNLAVSTAGPKTAVINALAELTAKDFDSEITYVAPTADTNLTITFNGDNTTETATISEKGKVEWQ